MERQALAKGPKSTARANRRETQSARSTSALHRLLNLQQSIGNQAVQRLMLSPYIQAKLQVSTSEDPFEQEADRVADTVMRMTDPGTTKEERQGEEEKIAETNNTPLQRKISQEEEQEGIQGDELLQKKALPGSEAVDSDRDDYKIPGGSGRPLGAISKEKLEQGFNANLDDVRIHDDSQAQSFVRERRAYAVTFGQNIYLGSGVREQGDGSISHTLAHEVAHTIQQRGSNSKGQISDHNQYQSLERQADQAANRVLSAKPADVPAGAVGKMEQAQGEAQPEISPEVRAAEAIVLVTNRMTTEQRVILQTHPPTYRRVVERLIHRDADWITDKLLEMRVDDDEESEIVDRLRKWALTPKTEGGNYLDEMLNAIRRFSYNFDYLVGESASGNMLDKLYSELEGENYARLLRTVDNFSVQYAGYRGRGSITRWSGIQTAVMPSAVRARISRLNQRLAGRVTIPMTPEEIVRVNDLYAQIRRRTLGLVDMPDLHVAQAPGQQVAPAAAAPVIGVAAIVYALVLAVLITIAIVYIIKILIEIERILDRVDFSSEPSPVTRPFPPIPVPGAPPIPVPGAPPIPVPGAPPIPIPGAPPLAPPLPIPRAGPRAVPRAVPRAIPRVVPRTLPRIPPVLPIIWPHWSGRGLPLIAPNPANSIAVGRPLVRTTPPPRNAALVVAFQAANTVLTGQAVHHVTPLFLGGPDALGNLAAVWISYHIAAHGALRIQPQMAAFGMPTDLNAHPPGVLYVVSAVV